MVLASGLLIGGVLAWAIATAALADQDLREAVSTRPLAAAQILTGLAFWLILLGFPIYRLLDTLTRSRSIEIAGGKITVRDRVFGRTSSWNAAVSEFLGVAPYLRASLSGVRHELILIHPERQRSILVAMAPRLMQSEVDQVASALRRGLRDENMAVRKACHMAVERLSKPSLPNPP